MSGRPDITESVADSLRDFVSSDAMKADAKSDIAFAMLKMQAGMVLSKVGFGGLKIAKRIREDSQAFYNLDDRTITVADEPAADIPLSRLLSHEMTHAIEHLFELEVEKKIGGIIDGISNVDFIDVKKRIQVTLPDGLKMPYHNQTLPKEGKTTKQLFIEETSAYIFEGIFYDMMNGNGAERFVKSYQAITAAAVGRRGDTEEDTKNKAVAQELVAVATHDICDAMIKHIEEKRGVGRVAGAAAAAAAAPAADMSKAEDALLARLTKIKTTVKPVYDSAISKSGSRGASVDASMGVPVVEARGASVPAAAAAASGGGSSGNSATMRSRLDVKSASIFISTEDLNATVTPSIELSSKAIADRMKASFTRIGDFSSTKGTSAGKTRPRGSSPSR